MFVTTNSSGIGFSGADPFEIRAKETNRILSTLVLQAVIRLLTMVESLRAPTWRINTGVFEGVMQITEVTPLLEAGERIDKIA